MADQLDRVTAALAGRYAVERELGAGGMATVYLAEDLKHHRQVAVKVLRPDLVAALGSDRFLREIEIAAKLNHPHILTLIESGTADGLLYYVMPHVQGESLRHVLDREGQLPVDEALRIAEQVASALECAHREGVVHRDVKPENVLLHAGEAMLADFGIALAVHEAADSRLTATGSSLGTPSYMSPEQANGSEAVDARTDVYSVGCMLYEMLAGRSPFQGKTPMAIVASILRDRPQPPSAFRSDLPSELDALVMRCLDADPDNRPGTGGELREELLQLRRAQRAPRSVLARPRVLVPIALAIVALVVGGAWTIVRGARAASFAQGALPQIDQLARESQYEAAYDLALEVEQVAGADAVPAELWDAISVRLSVRSEPSSDVSVQTYGSDGGWTDLGSTPLSDIRVPQGVLRWHVGRDGYVAAERIATAQPGTVSFVLTPADDPDSSMVRVPAGTVQLVGLAGVRPQLAVQLGDFLIDRHEVTNGEFKRFVDANGYERRELWTHEFLDGGRVLSFDEAMEQFHDPTGFPGPFTWQLGTYPDGEEDLPVGGISWYEAAAYAAWIGKELPTIYHWYMADAGGNLFALPGLLIPAGNYNEGGPHRASASAALGAYGTLDMAGNVREWVANASGDQRLALGGAWNDPDYVYSIPQVRSPFNRAPGNGFRLFRRLDERDSADPSLLPVPSGAGKDYTGKEPVDDETFQRFVDFFDSEPVALEDSLEATDSSPERWTRQRVSFAAGYGDERLTALLFLPKSSQPPYQVMIAMQGAGTFFPRSSAGEDVLFYGGPLEYLVRAGRAVLLPLWKGSFERADGFNWAGSVSAEQRDKTHQWVRELRQSLAYLESRSDIDSEKIGYQGTSWGALWGPMFLALEPRLKTGVLILGGLGVAETAAQPVPDDIDIFNYAPRVHQPVLMLNGRYDPIFPYETSQVPLYNLLPGEKIHLTYESGHSVDSWRSELFRESLGWLDEHFSKPAPAASVP